MLRRITVVIAIAVAFLFGLATTVYLSLRSPEVTVPDVMGKDRFEAENILSKAGLNFRVRATRPSNQVKSDTVLFQLPRAGEVVKTGQTVAMDISRATKEGESSVSPPTREEEKKSENASSDSSNSNDNKQARNKNTNKNTNENSNSTSNRNANANAGATRARTTANTNLNTNANASVDTGTGTANKTDEAKTTNSNTNNENSNRRPAPKPSPTERNNNRDNR